MVSGRGPPHLERKGSPSVISRWGRATYGEREGVIYIRGKRWCPICRQRIIPQESSTLSCQKTPDPLLWGDHKSTDRVVKAGVQAASPPSPAGARPPTHSPRGSRQLQRDPGLPGE